MLEELRTCCLCGQCRICQELSFNPSCRYVNQTILHFFYTYRGMNYWARVIFLAPKAANFDILPYIH